MAQKSWPSGAPSLAAAACIAETPGETAISSSSHRGLSSIASNTAAAMANTPGSPPETTATARPSAASVKRKPGAVQFEAIVAGVGALVGPQR